MSVVLVTGASGGIGGAVASAFAGKGHCVALGYCKGGRAAISLCEELKENGCNAMALKADLRDERQVDGMFQSIEALLGNVEILINCAGLSHFGLLTDMPLLQWEEIIGVNLTSVFLSCRRALPSMLLRHSGCIINISSIWGETGASCEAAYSAAKAGVIGLTKALAREEGPAGIRINCITPGLIETGMNARLSKAECEAFTQETALCRAGTAEEVAHAALFLAENTYVTGEVLRVDGGY